MPKATLLGDLIRVAHDNPGPIRTALLPVIADGCDKLPPALKENCKNPSFGKGKSKGKEDEGESESKEKDDDKGKKKDKDDGKMPPELLEKFKAKKKADAAKSGKSARSTLHQQKRAGAALNTTRIDKDQMKEARTDRKIQNRVLGDAIDKALKKVRPAAEVSLIIAAANGNGSVTFTSDKNGIQAEKDAKKFAREIEKAGVKTSVESLSYTSKWRVKLTSNLTGKEARTAAIRLAHGNPELRSHLLPLLRNKEADDIREKLQYLFDNASSSTMSRAKSVKLRNPKRDRKRLIAESLGSPDKQIAKRIKELERGATPTMPMQPDWAWMDDAEKNKILETYRKRELYDLRRKDVPVYVTKITSLDTAGTGHCTCPAWQSKRPRTPRFTYPCKHVMALALWAT